MSVLALTEAIQAAGVPIDGVADLGSGNYRIDFQAEATQEQRTQAEAIATAFHVTDAKQARIAVLDAWYAGKVAGGVTVSGILLAADLTSQNRFDALTTLLFAALQAGVQTGSDNTTVYSPDGTAHTMTISNYLLLMLGYGQILQGFAASYSTTLKAINDATTVEGVNAAEMPA